MGYWGMAPWDNDQAADWFLEVFEKTGLANVVADTLAQEIEPGSSIDQIRAAAALLILLGRNYVYSEQLEEHLALAVRRMKAIRESAGWGEYAQYACIQIPEGPQQLAAWFDNEIALLERRIDGDASSMEGQEQAPPHPPPLLAEWWQEWM